MWGCTNEKTREKTREQRERGVVGESVHKAYLGLAPREVESGTTPSSSSSVSVSSPGTRSSTGSAECIGGRPTGDITGGDG